MPNIEEYDSGINPESTINTRQASGESAFSGVAALGQGIEKLGKGVELFQARKEASESAAKLATIQEDAIQKIKNMPNSLDEDGIRDFMTNEVGKQLQAAQDKIGTSQGQEFLSKQSRYMQNSVFSTLMARNSLLQGKEVAQNFNTAAQKQSAIAYDTATIEQMNISAQSIDEAAKAVSEHGDANGERLASESKRNVAFATFDGILLKGPRGPENAQKELDAGSFNDLISFGEKGGAVDKATMQNKINDAVRRRDMEHNFNINFGKNQENQVQRENFNQLYDQIQNGVMDFKGIQKARDGALISPTQHQSLNNYLKTRQDGANNGDANVFQKAMSDLRSGKVDNAEDLIKDYGIGTNKGLSDMQVKMLMGTYLNPAGKDHVDPKAWNALIDDAKNQIVNPKVAPWGDRVGLTSWADFLTNAHNTFQQKVKAGADPNDLLDKNSPNYLGKSISSYQRTKSEITNHNLEMMKNPQLAVDAGRNPSQPIGSNPLMTPLPKQKSKQTELTPLQKAALDSIKLPPAGGK